MKSKLVFRFFFFFFFFFVLICFIYLFNICYLLSQHYYFKFLEGK